MNQLITHSPTWIQEMLAHLKIDDDGYSKVVDADDVDSLTS